MQRPAPMPFRRRLPNVLRLSPLLLLTACGAFSSGTVKPALPPPPPGLVACTDAPVTPLPGARGTAWDSAAVTGIIGDQRSDAMTKARCSWNWRKFYEDLRTRLAK